MNYNQFTKYADQLSKYQAKELIRAMKHNNTVVFNQDQDYPRKIKYLKKIASANKKNGIIPKFNNTTNLE